MAQPQKKTSTRDTVLGCGCLSAIVVGMAVAISVWTSGGGSGPAATSQTTPVPAASLSTSPTATACSGHAWPSKVPAVVGKDFFDTYIDATAGLECFNVVHAVAPDGHDALNDTVNGPNYVIAKVEPAPGTKVDAKTAITLYLRDVNAAPPDTAPAAPAAPPGATAVCNDGTYSFSQHHQGTCSHHHGVAQWL